MNSENEFHSGFLSSFIMSFILLISLLILPNSGCDRNGSGRVFTMDQLIYKVHTKDKTSGTGTVSIEGMSERLGSIEFPASVTSDGINYSVTSIGREAFHGCRSLTNVHLLDFYIRGMLPDQ